MGCKVSACVLPVHLVSEAIIGVSLSEPLSVELAGAFLWYIYICIHGQSIWSREGPQKSCKSRASGDIVNRVIAM